MKKKLYSLLASSLQKNVVIVSEEALSKMRLSVLGMEQFFFFFLFFLRFFFFFFKFNFIYLFIYL